MSLFKIKPAFTEVDPYRVHYNIGSLLDIPTGKYIKGLKGENILNGGLSTLTAIVGRGNTFKSTISRHMLLSAVDKVFSSGISSYINTYDTEMSIQPDQLVDLCNKFPSLKGRDLVQEGIWSVTNKTNHIGNEWFKILKDFLKKEKLKNAKDYTFKLPFASKDGKPLSVIFPTFGEIDSISEFETSDIEEIQDKNELGDTGGNMIHARSGLAKTRLLMELPTLCNSTSHYLIMTAHLGDGMAMQQGPYNTPVKKLQHMKQGDKIKGVSEKFFFLPNVVWQTQSSHLLNNQNTKGPEYPKLRNQPDEGSTDLNLVTIKTLRNKSGASGVSIDLIVSQEEGVLPSLTEFHYIKENGRYGLEGSVQNYSLALYPDVKLQRTTVRETIDNDPCLRRALKITADMLQILTIHKPHLKLDSSLYGLEFPTPEQLYAKLDKKYGFKKLLETRDYWTFENYDNPIPFLSTLDMLEMYHDKYIPYWIK